MGNLKHSNHKKESIKTKNLISMPPPKKLKIENNLLKLENDFKELKDREKKN